MTIQNPHTYTVRGKYHPETNAKLTHISLKVEANLVLKRCISATYWYNDDSFILDTFFTEEPYFPYYLIKLFLDCDDKHAQLGIEVPVVYTNELTLKKVFLPYGYTNAYFDSNKRRIEVYQSLTCPDYMSISIYDKDNTPKPLRVYAADSLHKPDFKTIDRIFYGTIEVSRRYYEGGIMISYAALDSLS